MATVWDGFYGTPFTPRALANQIVDFEDSYGYRFVAARTGTIAEFQPHIRLTTSSAQVGDYANGDGGTTTFSLYPDDGTGLPDTGNAPIATATYTPDLYEADGVSQANPQGYGPAGDGVLSFSNNHPLNFPTIPLNAPVVEGQTYHLLATNPSATDYISLNHGFSTDHTGGPTRGPLAPTVAEWGITQKRPQSNNQWAEYTTRELASGAGVNRYESALVLTMADGYDFGLAFADPRYDNDVTVTGSTQLRQLFTPADTTAIDGLQMHTLNGGTVDVIVERADGTGQLVNETVDTSSDADWAWDQITFPEVSVLAGVEYQIRFEPVSGSTRFGMGRLGDESLGKLWPVAQSFDGLAQESADNGANWSDVYIGTDVMGLAFSTPGDGSIATNDVLYRGWEKAGLSAAAAAFVADTGLTVHGTLASPTVTQLNNEITAASNASTGGVPRVVEVSGTITIDAPIALKDLAVVRCPEVLK